MSNRLFKIIKNYTNNNDYTFSDLREFIDQNIMNDNPKAKTIATRYSLTKNFIRDNYPEITEKQLKLIKPDDELTNSIIQKDLEIKSNKKNIKFDDILVNKILDFKQTNDLYELAIYLQFISGRRADEIKDPEYKIRATKDNKLKMLLSKKNNENKNKYFTIQIIPDTITPAQFKQSVNVLRQNMNHIGSNDYIKRLNRKIKKLVRKDLTSHNLRGFYASYMFNEHNPDNQNINGFISKILNHDSDNSSLNYSNYIYEKTKKKVNENVDENVDENIDENIEENIKENI